jgi:TolB protein
MKLFKPFINSIIIVTILCLTLVNQGFGAINFTITDNGIEKSKILIYGFSNQDENLNNDILEIKKRIIKNIDSTNLVEFIDDVPNDIITQQAIPDIESVPNFLKFQNHNIAGLLIGKFNYNEQGDLELRVRLWDINDRKQDFGKHYLASRYNYRQLANSISNEIFKAVSREAVGHFSSRIVYVGETGPINQRIKKINMIDFDGENYRNLTDDNELVLTPNFTKNQNLIYYLRYFENKPQIFSLDLRNKNTDKLGGFQATTFASSPHPLDDNLVILSAIIDGNCDIYEMNIAENFAKRLTKNPAIDTTASYSPDGKLIVFSSDRQAGQQLYVMNSNGSYTSRISQGTGSYSKPSWSPDGKLIAFTKIKSGQFMVGTMTANGRAEKILTTGYLVEGARWSPNGRYLIYSKKKGSYGRDSIPRLYTVDIITGHEYEIPTPKNEGALDPDWSLINAT